MRIKNTCILLKDIHLHAFHGVYEEEHKNGTEYVLNLRLTVEGLEDAAESDKLEDTIDYSTVYQRVVEEMQTPSNLIEHVAKRIAKRIINDFESVYSVWISIEKKNPPRCCNAAIEMTIEK